MISSAAFESYNAAPKMHEQVIYGAEVDTNLAATFSEGPIEYTFHCLV